MIFKMEQNPSMGLCEFCSDALEFYPRSCGAPPG